MKKQTDLKRRSFVGVLAAGAVGKLTGISAAGGEVHSRTVEAQENEGLEDYANQVGRVNTEQLNRAFDDWNDGEIDIGVLDDCIDAWNNGTRVVEYEVVELGSISEATTLERHPDGGEAVVYQVSSSISVDARLEIEPGVGIEFEEGASMTVNSGPLVAQGTEEEPILFTATNPMRGWWERIYVDSTHAENELDHCILEYGGQSDDILGAGYDGTGDEGSIILRNSTIRRSANWGIGLGMNHVDNAPSRILETENNTYSHNRIPVYVQASNADGLNSDDEFFGNDNAYVEVFGDSLRHDSTWDNLDVPYQVRDEVETNGYDWEIGTGTTIELEEDAKIDVESGSEIDWQGAPREDEEPNGTPEPEWITFTGTEKQRGWWGGIRISSNSANNVLEYVTVEYGGDPNEYDANIRADDGGFEFRNCRLRHSGSHGLRIRETGDELRETFGNVYENNADAPVRAYTGTVHGLDGSAEFVDNDEPYVFVRAQRGAGGTDMGAVTWDALDVPYRMEGTDHTIDSGDWTIEPGTTLEFEEGGEIEFEGNSIVWEGEPPAETGAEPLKSASEQTTGTDGAPNADFEWSPEEPEAGEEITFDASDSSAPDGEIVAYRWDFTGDGSVDEETADSTTSYTYDESGVKGVTLQVVNDQEETDTFSSEFSVQDPEEPTASFQWSPSEPEAGEEITFDATDSSAPDGEIVAYRWDFTGDGSVDEETADPTTSYAYDDHSDYEVELTIEDENGQTDELVRVLSVQDVPEWITFTATQEDRGWWDGIYLDTTSTNNVLDYVIVEYGGGGDRNANIEAGTDMGRHEGRIDLRNSIIRHSGSYGLRFSTSSRIENTTNNTYENNAAGAAWMRTTNAHGFNSNDTFEDNDESYVYVEGNRTISEDVTWEGLDVPYRLGGGGHTVDQGTMTIEPGAILEFEEGEILEFESTDAVIDVVGTEDNPISFTDVIETPGSWDGILIDSESLQNTIEHAVIEYGGNATSDDDEDANVMVGTSSGLDQGQLTLRDSTIRSSSNHGVYISSDSGATLENNEFENNAGQNVRDES